MAPDGNNIKELRLAFLLTPQELAARMGTYPEQVLRLEASEEPLPAEWIESVSEALGVPSDAVIARRVDYDALIGESAVQLAEPFRLCPSTIRFALTAVVARLAGLSLALGLPEDELAIAVRNIIDFVEHDRRSDATPPDVSRLFQSLQITVVAILQARGVVLTEQDLGALRQTTQAAAAMIEIMSASPLPGEAGSSDGAPRRAE